jgi:hypothetical protein
VSRRRRWRHAKIEVGLALESSKTKLVEFGRFAQRYASKRGRRRPETVHSLGFTLYCTRNRNGQYRFDDISVVALDILSDHD